MISEEKLYDALIQLLGDAESISWNRLYNFLMGNSILVLAWATIYASMDRSIMTVLVLSAICILGGVTGIAWSILGARSRRYHRLHLKQAIELEGSSTFWPATMPATLKPYTTLADSEKPASFFTRSAGILVWVPLAMTVLYLLLMIASLIQASPNTPLQPTASPVP